LGGRLQANETLRDEAAKRFARYRELAGELVPIIRETKGQRGFAHQLRNEMIGGRRSGEFSS
jgi:hypothetical protein